MKKLVSFVFAAAIMLSLGVCAMADVAWEGPLTATPGGMPIWVIVLIAAAIIVTAVLVAACFRRGGKK